MGRELQQHPAPVIGISNSRDLYGKLLHDAQEWQAGWGAYAGWNFVITAYHLHYDWATNDSKDSLAKTKRTDPLPGQMTLFLEGIKHLANGSKHFRLHDKPANNTVSRVHAGKESNWYSYFFHEDLPGVTLSSGHYFSVRSIHRITLAYFEWVFDDKLPLSAFPSEVIEAIDYGLTIHRTKKFPSLLEFD